MGGVSLLNDCPFASRAGDSFLPLAELTVTIKVGSISWLFTPLVLIPDSGRFGESWLRFLYTEGFLSS